MKCKIRKGLLILSDCDAQTRRQCVVCSRSMCDRHTKIDAQRGAMCTDCYAKQYENESKDSDDSAVYRHSFYQSNSYRGIYLGTYFDTYYNDYDLRSFDSDYTSQENISEDGEGNFFDS